MIPRIFAAALKSKLRSYPAVLLLGPRHCGKTHLLQDHLGSWKRLDLEKTSDLQTLSADPHGVFAAHRDHLIIDEAHRFPEVFSALRDAIDRDRRPGRYLLAGSVDPRLMPGVLETLPGRVGVIEMAPLLLAELQGHPAALGSRWFWGGFPPLQHHEGPARRSDWLSAYLAAVLERDIPALGVRLPPARLLALCRMLAHVHGGLLNLSELAASLSVSHHTVDRHIGVLEGAFLVRRLQPYAADIGKRLTKSPKLYVRDTGLLHHLAGLDAPAQLETWPRRAASWEGLLVEEIVRRVSLELPGARAFFWRTQAGCEVDLILELGTRRIAVDIRLAADTRARSLQGLRQCMADLRIAGGLVIHGGQEVSRVGDGITLLPWKEVLQPRFISMLGL